MSSWRYRFEARGKWGKTRQERAGGCWGDFLKVARRSLDGFDEVERYDRQTGERVVLRGTWRA